MRAGRTKSITNGRGRRACSECHHQALVRSCLHPKQMVPGWNSPLVFSVLVEKRVLLCQQATSVFTCASGLSRESYRGLNS